MVFQVERTMTREVKMVAWSPTMDLLAIGTTCGKVSVVRTCLAWQNVWEVQDEGDCVVSLVWREDGKVLAISYNNTINLHMIEGGSVLHSTDFSTGGKAYAMTWCSAPYTPLFTPLQPIIPYIPPLEDVKADVLNTRELLQLDNNLNPMFVVDEKCLRILAQGTLLIGSIPCDSVQTAALNTECSRMAVISCEEKGTLCTLYDPTLIRQHKDALNDISSLYSKVLTLSEYLLTTFKTMSDTWQDVLHQFNNKLFSFHMSLHPSNLSLEFMHLLVSGNASLELENFLVNTLKEKEIEKLLKHTTQCYQAIEKLVSINFMTCCQALSVHLTTLQGMARWYDRYGEVGLSEQSVQNCCNKLCSLMIKGQELLQCISLSKKKLGAFLKWLLRSTIVLSDTTETTVSLSEEEQNLVIDFLKNSTLFSKKADKHYFNVDYMWQYFTDSEVTVPPEYLGNDVLERIIDLLKDKKPYLCVEPKLSLVQTHKIFSKSLIECFELENKLHSGLTRLQTVDISRVYSISNDAKHLHYVSDNIVHSMVLESSYTVVTHNIDLPANILSVHCYDKDFVVLAQDNEQCVVSVCYLSEEVVSTGVGSGVDTLCVSGSRRLGALVSSQRRRIRVLDLDEDEEEE